MKTMKSKEILTIVLIVISGFYFIINKKTETNKVTITGKISNPIGESVSFFSQDTSYSTTSNKNGTFSISFDLDSSTYLSFRHGPEVTAMYIKPGDRINLTIDTDFFDETIRYTGSVTSSFLAKKYLLEEEKDFFGEVYYLASTEEYKTYLDAYRSSLINELNEIKDTVFTNSEIYNIDKDMSYFAQRQKKMSEYSDDARNYMWETREISRNFDFYTALDSLNSTEFNDMTKRYTEAFASALDKVADTEFSITTKEKIKNTTSAWIERKTLVDNVPKEGDPAIDFKYADKDGNKFSLSSFNGNLIYVDVWATWCGPCVAEIPSLQKLESDYHAKNITFITFFTLCYFWAVFNYSIRSGYRWK